MQTDSSDTLMPPPPAAELRLHPQQQKLPDGDAVVRVYQVCAAVMTAVSYSSSTHKQAIVKESVT
jgi:hypothetical protein